MKRLRMLISLLGVCTAVGLLNQANAQPKLPTPIADPLDTIKPHLRRSLDIGVIDDTDQVKRRAMANENMRSQMQQYLLMRIDELKRVCKLSEEQETDLHAAVEAAVEQALAGGAAPQRGWKLDRNTPPSRFSGAVHAAYYWYRPAAAAQQPAWTSAVERVLSEDQKAADREAQTKRLKLVRQIEVQTLVAAMDEHLLLSAGQREELADLIRKTYELQKSVIPPGQVFTLSGQPDMPGGVSVTLSLPQFGRQFPPDALAKILNPKQLARWQDLLKITNAVPEMVVPIPQ